jgi:hypothetical protein
LNKYGSNAESKDRDDFLKLIPDPDGVFLAAAKRAVVAAGLSNEAVEILHPENQSEPSYRWIGSIMQKMAPRGLLGIAQSRPPCATTIERQIDSPIPNPSDLVV